MEALRATAAVKRSLLLLLPLVLIREKERKREGAERKMGAIATAMYLFATLSMPLVLD